HWHADLRPDDTPLEAGLAFTCKMKRPIPFQGRERLEKQKEEGLRRRIVCFTIDEMGVTYKAKAHLKSPFDPENKRVKGIYE
ncbi:hypothetical protein XENOCAPTIV_000896, partial [Xenoophorus captivus]